jgi:hypothetical protein
LELQIGYEDSFGLIVSPILTVSVVYVGDFCFDGSCCVNVRAKYVPENGVELREGMTALDCDNEDGIFEIVRKKISEVVVGDLVQSERLPNDSTPLNSVNLRSYHPVLASVRTRRRFPEERFEMVRVRRGGIEEEDDEALLVTKGHPIRLQRSDRVNAILDEKNGDSCSYNSSSEWIRPENVGVALELDIDEVYNFVIEGNSSIWVNGIECASLGMSR